ncbi:hypothetical protein [Actomonas aquatica]|uniref:Uncharacterized protein n=1 Tax=Actomonas aquatica TaxID=2866162 RepID=A0ABZ1C4J6_9BACT|nr:hypothetical protein [Opitutus sp. WL0086]WRQ86639.1 hypothetical protein K1X11_017645 [Opitutus sp. WL0086]
MSSLRGWRRLGFGLALLGMLAAPMFGQKKDEEAKEAPFTAVRAADSDTIAINNAGQVTLSMAQAPSSATDAKLLIVNSANFALWSAPLSRVGGKWTAQLDLPAVEALLTGNAVQAEFPGAAPDGKKDFRVSFVRDMFSSELAATASLVKPNQPLFYKAPEKPEPLETISSDTDAVHMGSYAMASRRYDEQLSAYRSKLIVAKASAHALWSDIKTADRLPEWPASLIAAQEKAYKSLQTEIDAVAKLRDTHRATAESVVSAWNSANSDADEIPLTFRAES